MSRPNEMKIEKKVNIYKKWAMRAKRMNWNIKIMNESKKQVEEQTQRGKEVRKARDGERERFLVFNLRNYKCVCEMTSPSLVRAEVEMVFN